MERPSSCCAGDLAQRRHAGDVGAAFAELGIDRRQHVALVERIEDFHRTNDFKLVEAARSSAVKVGGPRKPRSVSPSRARASWP